MGGGFQPVALVDLNQAGPGRRVHGEDYSAQRTKADDRPEPVSRPAPQFSKAGTATHSAIGPAFLPPGSCCRWRGAELRE